MMLEFLELQQKAAYYERNLEMALISHLQGFMLELGNGFSFAAWQKRIHIDRDAFLATYINNTHRNL